MSGMQERLTDALGERYSIEQEIGRGGMATVYRAQDLKHGRSVALKVLHPDLSLSLGNERFLREIRITAGLTHPHILPLHDSGAVGEILYYVMPFFEGETLRSKLAREGALGVDEALSITREVADALGYAHSRGVVHRDIKPENIALTGGHAVVLDFGVALAIGAAGGERVTAAGWSVGTPAYMSPEQAAGNDIVDGRADIYSLACVLFEMLAGRPPFSGGSYQTVIARVLTETPPALNTLRPGLPPALESAVARSLAKLPADRFATAAYFVEALARGAPPPEQAAPAADKTVVVLDFRNISGDESVAWLGSGIAETVTVDLKKVAGARVIGRERVVRALRTLGSEGVNEANLTDVGRSLGARWVVWGGFQKLGNMIRITPQFRATSTDEVVSAAKIDGALDDIFALQDRIVTELMKVLEVELTDSDVRRIRQPETTAVKAYELYAKGRQLFNLGDPAQFEQARQLFEQALELDPKYALAYSGLGSIHAFRYVATTRRDDLERGVELLRRALEFDPDLAEPYRWLTFAYQRDFRFEESERAGLRAVELEADHPTAHYFLAVTYQMRGWREHRREDYRRAITHHARAVHLQPSFAPASIALGWIYVHHGQYRHARGLLEHAARLEESGQFREIRSVGGITSLAALFLREGDLERARRTYERALQQLGQVSHVFKESFTAWTLAGMGEIAYRAGSWAEAEAGAAKAVAHADAHRARLGMGHFLIKARLVQAKALHRLGRAEEAKAALEVAERLAVSREGYDFNWVWDGGDVVIAYDLASAYAALGRREDALAALRRAVACGWGDLGLLAGDEALKQLAADGEARALVAAAAAREPLPEEPAGGITSVIRFG
jgi:serine/threonine-protein kinase